MFLHTFRWFAFGIGLASTLQANAQEVAGSGTTFVSTIYAGWTFAYTKETGLPAVYRPTNAADGVARIIARQIDFAATEPAIAKGELQRHKLIQIPMVAGAVVPVVNLEGIAPGALRLTPDVLADIFEGTIKNWKAPRIALLNPTLNLPNLPIIRVVREPGSGTTFEFTRYLSAVSPRWSTTLGEGNAPAWRGPVTVGRGMDGVIKALETTAGAITYVTYDRVKQGRLKFVQLKNRSGKFVEPSEASIKASLKLSKMFKDGDETVSLIDLPGDEVWPITAVTYAVLDAQPAAPEKINPTLRFIYWVFLKGDSLVDGTGFVPLPSVVQARAISYLSAVRPLDGRPVQFAR